MLAKVCEPSIWLCRTSGGKLVSKLGGLPLLPQTRLPGRQPKAVDAPHSRIDVMQGTRATRAGAGNVRA